MNIQDVVLRLTTLKQNKTVKAVGYRQFARAQKTPFVVYYVDNENIGGSDEINLIATQDVTIELYTDVKAPVLEKQIEDLFNDVEMSKSEVYISDEHMNMVKYDFTITNIIGG